MDRCYNRDTHSRLGRLAKLHEGISPSGMAPAESVDHKGGMLSADYEKDSEALDPDCHSHGCRRDDGSSGVRSQLALRRLRQSRSDHLGMVAGQADVVDQNGQIDSADDTRRIQRNLPMTDDDMLRGVPRPLVWLFGALLRILYHMDPVITPFRSARDWFEQNRGGTA